MRVSGVDVDSSRTWLRAARPVSEIDGDRLVGCLDNIPCLDHGLRIGDRVTLTVAEIVEVWREIGVTTEA